MVSARSSGVLQIKVLQKWVENEGIDNKIKKNKQENYEEGQTSSESEDEKTILQKADKT